MRVGIVGLGLIGGSLAGALEAAGHDVSGCDRDPSVEKGAFLRGLIGALQTRDQLAATADVVILCIPVNETRLAIPEIAPQMRDTAILTDVASVKRPIIEVMNRLDSGPRCVGGHPMAGKATGGVQAADPELFRDAPYALVRSTRSDDDAVGIVSRLAEDAGANPVEIDAESHDREVARTSHLPQVLSSAMSLAANGYRDTKLTGPGLAGMLRLARSDERLWSEILTWNADAVGDAASAFRSSFDGLIDQISSGDRAGVEDQMRQAREALG